MKIIAPGRDCIGWSREFDCTGKGNEGIGCNARLLVEEADIWFYVVNNSWGRETFYSFICPLCGCMTDISHSLISGETMDHIRKRCEETAKVSYVRAQADKVKTLRLANRKKQQE